MDNICRRCGSDEESIDHIFLHCPFPKAVWLGSPFGLRIPLDPTFTVSQWLQQVLKIDKTFKSLGEQVFSYVAFMFWTLWKMQNDLYFNQQVHKLEVAILRASKVCWTPPRPGNVKLNANVAWRQHHVRHGLGYVVRDDHGTPLFAVSKLGSFLSVSIGEASMIKARLLQIIQAGFINVTVESDNLEVIQMLQRKTKVADPYLADILKEIVSLVTGSNLCITFEYIPINVNVVAHVLARKAMSCVEQVLWPLTSHGWLMCVI
ncbi:hypothetical protein NE237_031915 [Protea cynaroides]|uniref:RNase H type-1 domain-containing protein n=1 Tax=Protea cynaroides TaxID=273540 RepID=A0A9Q0L251_9MAGN|nr:hypothetical protein NE237_031915 [Protea cynaroides]